MVHDSTMDSFDVKSLTRGSVSSEGFKRNRQDISEFPCYGTQEDLDVFIALSVVCNLRKNYIPCIDCNQCFQSEMHSKGSCRYPNAEFRSIKLKTGKTIIDGIESLGIRREALRKDIEARRKRMISSGLNQAPTHISKRRVPEEENTIKKDSSESFELPQDLKDSLVSLRQDILNLPLFSFPCPSSSA